MHEWDWVIKTFVELQKIMVLITIYHEKSPKKSHYTNVVPNFVIYVCRKNFLSFLLIQILYWTKGIKWFPSVTREIHFCWPTLRNNCHDMVFSYLLQSSIYKDTDQNWNVLCCSSLLIACGKAATYHFRYQINFIDYIYENQLITFIWQWFTKNFFLKKCINIFLSSFIAWRLFYLFLIVDLVRLYFDNYIHIHINIHIYIYIMHKWYITYIIQYITYNIHNNIYYEYYIIYNIERVWTKFSGFGFKSHSDQHSIATSKNPLVTNTIYIIYM